MFQYYADAALLTDCATARRLPVAMEADYLALERAYLEARLEPGARVLITFEGRLAKRPAMEGEGTREFLVVERYLGIWPGETCGNPGATEVLENTYWKLTRLNDTPVRVFADQPEPYLVLRSVESQVAGSGGCNRFHGGYELDGDALTFGPAGATMMSCPAGQDQEHAFLQALDLVRNWRIDGQHLELVDQQGTVLLRFEARAMP
jgi:copper homeostasis protein (lipoprotein)